jgi:acetolactate synthase-1/2/3 large subunit
MTRYSNCASVIARTLHRAGARYVFGHPGGEVVELIDAFETEGLRFILTGHEATAAFMAGTVGRLTETPGVCVATLGPGACNLVLGVGSALLDRDPLLAFSARTATHRIHRSNKQNLPLNALFAPITKWSTALYGTATETTIREALNTAATPPRGPVYVTIPADVATGEDRPDDPMDRPPGAPSHDSRNLDELIARINAARRPVGVVGIAMDAAKDAPAVRRFFQDTGIPFTVTVQAKGIADETDSRFLGTVAPAAGERHIIEWLKESDCIVGVGFDPVESSQLWHYDAPLYIVANAPVGFGDYRPKLECVGDVPALLDRIRDACRGRSLHDAAAIASLRKQVDDSIRPPCAHTSTGLSPYHLVSRLREWLPEETVLTSDVGAHKNVIGQVWRAPAPGSFLMSNGLSSMGYGVASCMAAALLYPERPVVAVTGDGAFSMMVHELETTRRTGIAPLFIILCDASLAVIKVAQKLRGLPHRGVDFLPVDWVQVAEGYGVRAKHAGTMEEVEDAVRSWLADRHALALAVAVDESLYTGLQY